MDSSTHLLIQWLADESGVTAIEYGLLAALIAVAIIGGLNATSTSVIQIYNFWSAAVIAAL
jgi:pilus assembly protein Flp/PilA